MALLSFVAPAASMAPLHLKDGSIVPGTGSCTGDILLLRGPWLHRRVPCSNVYAENEHTTTSMQRLSAGDVRDLMTMWTSTLRR